MTGFEVLPFLTLLNGCAGTVLTTVFGLRKQPPVIDKSIGEILELSDNELHAGIQLLQNYCEQIPEDVLRALYHYWCDLESLQKDLRNASEQHKIAIKKLYVSLKERHALKSKAVVSLKECKTFHSKAKRASASAANKDTILKKLGKEKSPSLSLIPNSSQLSFTTDPWFVNT